MKFHIFGLWEKIIKPVLYTIVFVSTVALIYVFFTLDSESETYGIFVFVAPVIYALFLFLANIYLEKSKQNVSELLYERESFYLSLLRLREIVNATINKIDKDDFGDVISKVTMFQIMTGRDEATVNALAKGEKAPHIFVKENGFLYTSKMSQLEATVLRFVQKECVVSQKAMKKSMQHLFRCYQRSTKKLEDNILRLRKTYTGELQRLVDTDNYISDFDYKIEDAISKIEDAQRTLEEAEESNKALEDATERTLELLKVSYTQLSDRLDNIEGLILSLPTEVQLYQKVAPNSVKRGKDEQI